MTYVAPTAVTSDAAPSTTLLTAIESALTTHPAWEFVEERVVSTYTCRVWKCLAAYNAQGIDFYIAFRRATATIGTSLIDVLAGETYDTGTGNMTRYCPPTGSTYTPDGTYNAITGATASNLTIPYIRSITTSTVTFTYSLLVTNNALMVYCSTTSGFIYVGIFNSVWTEWGTKEFPLIVASPGATAPNASISRLPGVTTSTSSAASTTISANVTWETPVGSIAGTIPAVAASKARGARPKVTPAADSSTPRGAMYDVLYFNCAAGVVAGDTATVDGRAYICYFGSTTFSIWVDTEAT